MKEENELEVVSRYDKNRNDNEGKIFRSDKNKKIKLKKHTHTLAYLRTSSDFNTPISKSHETLRQRPNDETFH